MGPIPHELVTKRADEDLELPDDPEVFVGVGREDLAVGVSRAPKIPASDVCSEVGPEPASTREGDKDRPRRRPIPRPEPTSTREETRMSDDARYTSRRRGPI